MQNMPQKNAERAIMRGLFANSLAPNLLEDQYFKEMLHAVAACGPSFKVPSRKLLSLCGETPGELVVAGLNEWKVALAQFRKSVKFSKATLASDGARNGGIDALNSVVVASVGCLGIQSTDVTGCFKDANFIFADLKKAIEVAGGDDIIFIVCLDGASSCKAVLKMVDEFYSKIFGQRCNTHGWSLLIKDLTNNAIFGGHIKEMHRLIKFITNHSGIYSLFKRVNNDQPVGKPLALFLPCPTRFGTHALVAERVEKDKVPLKRFWNSEELTAWLAHPAQRPVAGKLNLADEHEELGASAINSLCFWRVNEVYVALTEKVLVPLRLTDTNSPNLVDVVHNFLLARADCVKIANESQSKYPTIFAGFVDMVNRVFDKRSPDICTPLSLAASCINTIANFADPQVNLPPNAYDHLVTAVKKYFQIEGATVCAEVMAIFSDFRAQRGFFGEAFMVDIGKRGENGRFWEIAATHNPRAAFFCYLANGYAGQGASERMNKVVTKNHTKARNRQVHMNTDAQTKIQMFLRQRQIATQPKSFIAVQRARMLRLLEKIEEIRDGQEHAGPAMTAAPLVENDLFDEYENPDPDPENDQIIREVLEEALPAPDRAEFVDSDPEDDV